MAKVCRGCLQEQPDRPRVCRCFGRRRCGVGSSLYHATRGNPRSIGRRHASLQMPSEETGLLDWSVNGVDNEDGSYLTIYSDIVETGMILLVLTQVSAQQTSTVLVLVIEGPTFLDAIKSSVLLFPSANFDDLGPHTPAALVQFEGGSWKTRWAHHFHRYWLCDDPIHWQAARNNSNASGAGQIKRCPLDCGSMATLAIEPIVTHSYVPNACLDTLAIGSLASVPLRLTSQACIRHGNLKTSSGDEFIVEAPQQLNSTVVDSGEWRSASREVLLHARDPLWWGHPHQWPARSGLLICSSKPGDRHLLSFHHARRRPFLSIHAFDESENPLTKVVILSPSS